MTDIQLQVSGIYNRLFDFCSEQFTNCKDVVSNLTASVQIQEFSERVAEWGCTQVANLSNYLTHLKNTNPTLKEVDLKVAFLGGVTFAAFLKNPSLTVGGVVLGTIFSEQVHNLEKHALTVLSQLPLETKVAVAAAIALAVYVKSSRDFIFTNVIPFAIGLHAGIFVVKKS